MAELLSFSTLILCFLTILIMARFWGKNGLFAYATVAVIASNIQVLKLTKYALVNDPVALGTVLFSTIFAVDNILTEYYGAKTARKCVWMSFFCYLFFALVMKIAILHPIVYHSKCLNLHRELQNLFSPCFTFFISSLVSYIVGQMTDIFVFSSLKRIMKSEYVSVRSLISMAISTFVDNCVFSILAWIVFADNPISLSSLWNTYIFITYGVRLIIAVLCVPLVRLSGVVMPRKSNV
ncbi:MAG: queuosine precursor transporter [Holosporaceae bacterium]|nr:queuosine precursor transporter [Holosporaceae bacterium]